MDGIEAVNPNASIDLLTLDKSALRLSREGQYPPIRGTYALIEGTHPIIYTPRIHSLFLKLIQAYMFQSPGQLLKGMETAVLVS